MIDTHCHLLPGIDDGPRFASDALALARRMSGAGVRVAVCTPHFSRRFPTSHALAREGLEKLRTVLAHAELPLQLELAAEISPAAAVEAPADELRLRQLESGYLLVELEPDTPAGLLDVVMARLDDIGLRPVFAHPERCRAVRSQPHLLDSARATGALVQVVARSLTSRSSETGDAAWRLLESRRVDVLASDVHQLRHVDHLAQALAAVLTRLGHDVLTELTESNPTRMIAQGARRE